MNNRKKGLTIRKNDDKNCVKNVWSSKVYRYYEQRPKSMKKLDEEISKTSNYNYNKYLVRPNDYQKTENKV